MAKRPEWSKEVYEQSVSSRCWWFTPYDAGWDGCRDHGLRLSTDNELRQIVQMEREFGPVPNWASRIVETSIRFLPACGHYMFPLAYLECVSAIGSQTPSDFAHGCFTIDADQKKAMQDYCLCLDGWLAGAAPEAVARELAALGHRKMGWQIVCKDLWDVLGERTELKELLVELLLHSQRWKIKSRPWDDDPCARFGRDEYLGDFSEVGCDANVEGYVTEQLPGFDERSSPKVQRLEARAAEMCDDWEWFSYTIRYGWLCSPKAFRHLECLIWSIGKERRAVTTRDHPMEGGDGVPGFLRCEDTYVNQDEAASWWREFRAALGDWWQGREASGAVAGDLGRRLGERTQVKRWLVRLLRHRCELLASHSGSLGLLVHPSPKTKRGTKPLELGFER